MHIRNIIKKSQNRKASYENDRLTDEFVWINESRLIADYNLPIEYRTDDGIWKYPYIYVNYLLPGGLKDLNVTQNFNEYLARIYTNFSLLSVYNMRTDYPVLSWPKRCPNVENNEPGLDEIFSRRIKLVVLVPIPWQST